MCISMYILINVVRRRKKELSDGDDFLGDCGELIGHGGNRLGD